MVICKSLDFGKVVFSSCFLFFLSILQFFKIVINMSEGVVVVEMRDFSNSLMNQVGVLKGEKELTKRFYRMLPDDAPRREKIRTT